MTEEKKPLSPHGRKTRAGQLLSKWLRQIAEEETEVAVDTDGDNIMITKAEAIARLIWQRALGYVLESKNDDGTTHKEYFPPDRQLMSLIFDRIEGRAAMVTDSGPKKRSVADKVSEQGAKRIEQAGKIDATN